MIRISMRPVLKKIEYDAVDHCNLKCNFCIHSAQWKDKGELDITVIEDQITSLVKKFDVKHLVLKGGEPLIHSNIMAVLTSIRKYLDTETKFSVATNGIRLASLPNPFFLLVKHLGIQLIISEYDDTVDYEKIYAKLDAAQIPYVAQKKVVFYEWCDPDGKQDPKVSYEECQKREFYPLYRDKRFYLCCYVYDVPYLNNKFGYKIESNSISVDADAEEVVKYCTSPCKTCKFCTVYQRPHAWTRYEGA